MRQCHLILSVYVDADSRRDDLSRNLKKIICRWQTAVTVFLMRQSKTWVCTVVEEGCQRRTKGVKQSMEWAWHRSRASEGAQRIACPNVSCSCFSVSYRTKSMFSYSTPYICIRGTPAILPRTSKELSSFSGRCSPPWDKIAHFIGSKEAWKSLS